jgi:hypothetical protein
MVNKGQARGYVESHIDSEKTERAMLDEGSLVKLISPAYVKTLGMVKQPMMQKFWLKLLRAGSRKQASLRKTDAVGVRENPSSGPAKPGQPLREWIRIHSSRLFPSRSTRSYSCFSFSFY